MQESSSSAPAEGVAAYIGIDWADQKHDVILRAASEPAKVEHRRIAHEPEALMEWLGEREQRLAGKSKILVSLEQSRGALIYHLMGYEFLELYPINPSQLASFRQTFSPGGAKDDRPDAELICELLYCHRDRLKAWKPDDELTRKLAFLNEGRRRAVAQRTQLANQIKSQLKVYFPLALLKSLLPYIARYEKQIAELFDAHPDSFLFRDLPGAGSALGPRLLTAYGTDRERFEHSTEISSLSGVAPVRRASGKKSGKKASVHFRHACPKVPTPKLS